MVLLHFPQLAKHTIISPMNTSACFESSGLPPLNELEWHVSQCEQRCMSPHDSGLGLRRWPVFIFFSCQKPHLQWGCQDTSLLSVLLSKSQSPRTGKGVFSILIAQTDFTISFLQLLHQ